MKVLEISLGLESVIALLPTGAGKSLTYQLSAILQPGITLIIDPLKSLMLDQVKSLRNLGLTQPHLLTPLLMLKKNETERML